MAESRFDAQTITETTTRAATQTFEIVLEDANGQHLRLTLPLHLAQNALVPILAQLQSGARAASMPSFSKNVNKWQVGRSSEEAKVLLQFCDDPPYAMLAVDAKKFWREVREEAETVSRRSPPRRQ